MVTRCSNFRLATSCGIQACLLLAVVLLWITPCAAKPIYVYKQKDGSTRFSTTPPPQGVSAKVFTAKSAKYSHYRTSSGVWVRKGQLFRTRFNSHVAEASSRFGVDHALIRAVIHAESAFNPEAVSPKGALGLMQIMPGNLRRLGVRDPFSPRENILGGTRLLAMLQRKYNKNLRLALAAYNAGEGAVQKYGGVPPYRETVNYVSKVLSLKTRYSVSS